MIKKYSTLKKGIKGDISSPDFQYWFNGSILQKDGIPILLYHQTSKENEQKIMEEGYDISKGKARLSDEIMPDGIFLKYDESDLGLGAPEKENRTNMAFYVKLVNPLVVDDRNKLSQELQVNPEYSKLISELNRIDRERNKEHESLWEDMKRQERKSDAKQDVFEQVQKQLDLWQDEIRDLATKAREIGTEFLQSKGYDGVIVENDSGSFGRKVRTVVVFSPSQIRTAVPDKELPER